MERKKDLKHFRDIFVDLETEGIRDLETGRVGYKPIR